VKKDNLSQTEVLATEARSAIVAALERDGVAILPPMDVVCSLRLVLMARMRVAATILDPWYNKGVGGIRADYEEYVLSLLRNTAPVSNHVFLWGFPEIIARFVGRLPEPLALVAWLTWYYKNSPSVIRGWRSSQMACLHMSHPGARLFPEHFLNEAQEKLRSNGKLRYMPGPTSVIEESLLVGFVGRKEQTGHPAQKPVAVFEKLLLMTTREGDVVLDPMSGSGTTGVAARQIKRASILSDHSEEYTQIAEERLGVERIALSDDLRAFVDNPVEGSFTGLCEEFTLPVELGSISSAEDGEPQSSLFLIEEKKSEYTVAEPRG
jgi:hypothetical protein